MVISARSNHRVDKSLTLNGYETQWNYNLSPTDKEYAARFYPSKGGSTGTGNPTPVAPTGGTRTRVTIQIHNNTQYDVGFLTEGLAVTERRLASNARQTFTFDARNDKSPVVDITQLDGTGKRYTVRNEGSYRFAETASNIIVLQNATAPPPVTTNPPPVKPNPPIVTTPTPVPTTPLPVGPRPAVLNEGDLVWAEWKPNDWYHGKISRRLVNGYQILFDDGETATVTTSKIASDRIPASGTLTIGTRVLAKWTDGRLYPAKISNVKPAFQFAVDFDDGEKGVAKWNDLRVIGR